MAKREDSFLRVKGKIIGSEKQSAWHRKLYKELVKARRIAANFIS